ncbi:hypothetical protein NQ318_018259 [Aromia moschata]|uniref:RNase H type-1 domain-containing protein n=1 Tax=Aromia moschata TaxID=1265417 RepID=A0AAV8ZGC2_9CUCU|nr:hypothetical protein NQ318_018259 [Aromia moschata]
MLMHQKNENSVSCSVITLHNTIVKHLLPSHCSVHTGELYGILTAVNTITNTNKTVAICTDSLSSIHSINNIYTQNPLAQNIQETCHVLASQNISVSILWVPSHVGIIGNERADQAAKEALNSDLTVKEVQLYKDLKNTLKQITTNKWQNLCNQSNTKLQSIQPIINVNNLPPMNRRDKIKIRRLRIGHTRATHGYLMESGNPTLCEHCNCQLSVKHYLSECPQYNVARQRHNITGDTKEDLNPSSNLNNIINYLKDIKLYSYI